MAKDQTVDVWRSLNGNVGDVKLVICDLWGVMHNGMTLFEDAVDAIAKLRQFGIKTVFLTNAPKPASIIREQLRDKGMPADFLDNIVSSGSQARAYVRNHLLGKSLYHMGPDIDHQAVEGLDVAVVTAIDQADFIFASGLDHKTVNEHQLTLEVALANRIPFLCANPDRIVHLGNREWICAGAVAEVYENMGGAVHWFGKPTKGAFDACDKQAGLTNIDASQVLVIGDSLLTDIAGANGAGHKSLLVTSGIHRKSFVDISHEIHWPAIKGLPADDVKPSAAMDKLRY